MTENNHIANCPFCLQRDDALVFHSDQYFLAMYNRAPVLPGHTLIVPGRHVSSFDDLNDAELGDMLFFTRCINHILMKVFHQEGFNWTIQDGEPAGQTIEHMHLHVIPRITGDLPDPGDWYPRLKQSQENNIDSSKRPAHSYEELIKITEKLRKISAFS